MIDAECFPMTDSCYFTCSYLFLLNLHYVHLVDPLPWGNLDQQKYIYLYHRRNCAQSFYFNTFQVLFFICWDNSWLYLIIVIIIMRIEMSVNILILGRNLDFLGLLIFYNEIYSWRSIVFNRCFENDFLPCVSKTASANTHFPCTQFVELSWTGTQC